MPHRNRNDALQGARANARFMGQPYYAFCGHNGLWWVESNPPTPGPMTGACASGHCVIFPDGSVCEYDPRVGPPAAAGGNTKDPAEEDTSHADRPRDQETNNSR